MTTVTESFDEFMVRFVRKAVIRLLADEDIQVPPDLRELETEDDSLLAQIRMAVHLRTAVDRHIAQPIGYAGRPEDALLADESDAPRPTWKDFGKALGVSPQAAHRKYGPAVRQRDDAPKDI